MIRVGSTQEPIRTERGTSLVELLVATSVALGLAALFGHTVTAYHTGYHRATARVGGDQQAHFALALIADELGALFRGPSSTTCPVGGVRVSDGRVEFAANLHDRSTALRENAVAGRDEVVVATGGSFEVGDLVALINLNDPTDPSDDVADCVRITDIGVGRWTLESVLTRSFPAGSPVALVNRVAYALDRRGRLIRTQDGGTQRIAQDVATFDVRFEGAALVVRLAIAEAAVWTTRIAVEEGW